MNLFDSTSANRAYLASVLRTFAQILLRRTSDTLGTLYDICISHGCNPNVKRERLMERWVT